MEEMTYSDAVLQDYKMGIGLFSEDMPKLASAFHAFTEACFAEGKLGQKEKQLIALAISVYAHNEYCIIYHTKGCLDAGCSREEILEAVGVSAAFGGGAAMSQVVTLLQDALDEFTETP